MQIAQFFKTTKTSTSSLSYQQTCIEACSTTAGAYALADRLEAEEKAATLGGARRNQYRYQKEAAGLAAGYARLTNDLNERIPTALQAAEGLSRKNLKLAQDALKAAEQEAVTRQEKLGGYVPAVVVVAARYERRLKPR